jgi:predicted DsbA family dithiol-disulfide isomerase
MICKLKIDFVSDVTCPWCAVGLGALEQALERKKDQVQVELHFRPFELNPQMGPDGQDVSEHLTQKYGTTPEQQAQMRETIRQRGQAAGFVFRPEGRGRIWNTFDAHRLLHWAGLQDGGKQFALKKALLQAHHGRGESPASHAVLLAAAGLAGLDLSRAQAILASADCADEVRALQKHYLDAGIHSVPTVIFNDRHVLTGGQPVEVFEQAIGQLLAAQV